MEAVLDSLPPIPQYHKLYYRQSGSKTLVFFQIFISATKSPQYHLPELPQYHLPELPQYHLPELRGRRGRRGKRRHRQFKIDNSKFTIGIGAFVPLAQTWHAMLNYINVSEIVQLIDIKWIF